ncbi:MAG: hypothetical protein IJ168_08040 [Eubacterium sp.]|nr:hypothetical protein [Eubacterium sp.]
MSQQTGKQGHWVLIKCPFFHCDDAKGINCEGVKEDSTLRQIFRTKEDKRQWEKQYCELLHRYAECPIYRAAMKKYEESEE